MNIKQYLICFAATGMFFGCGEQLDTIERFPPPNVNQELLCELEEPYDYEVSSLNKYEPQSMQEFEEVLEMSKKQNKPLLLDFTGYTAVNARKFESNVWCNPDVYPILKSEFIIASFFVDNRLPMTLSESEEEKTVGEFWFEYQQEHYGVETQPMYDVVNSENVSLVSDVANYRTHGQEDIFVTWLQEGLTNY